MFLNTLLWFFILFLHNSMLRLSISLSVPFLITMSRTTCCDLNLSSFSSSSSSSESPCCSCMHSTSPEPHFWNYPQNITLDSVLSLSITQLTMANKQAAFSDSLTRSQLTESLFIALIFASLPFVLATTDHSDGTFRFSFLFVLFGSLWSVCF